MMRRTLVSVEPLGLFSYKTPLPDLVRIRQGLEWWRCP